MAAIVTATASDLPVTMPLPEQFSVAFLDGYLTGVGEQTAAHWSRVRAYLLTLERAIGPAA
ncbi:hypothetical protein ACAX61_03910 [Sphingomonas sp. IW22]